MNKYEIIKKIENFAPADTAEVWDPTGWVIETSRQNVSKIMLCLTPTDNIIIQAIEQGCDMIISHHPRFCINCVSEFISESYIPKIDIYSAHTNLDKAVGGTTDTLIDVLGLSSIKRVVEHEFLRVIEYEKGISVSEFSQILVKVSPGARIVNNYSVNKLKKIAFCAGSGADFIEDAHNLGADCLVIGDLKFHTALDSEIVLYDIGHFESEILVLPVIKNIVGSGVDIVFAKEESPFKHLCRL